MISIPSLLTLAHLLGLALGVGAATAKLVLLLKCNADFNYVPVYLGVSKPITRQIILGQALLTLSGIGWILTGYEFTTLLKIKVALVAMIWVVGPVIDTVAEPKFRKLAPEPGGIPTPEFRRAQKQHLALEVMATLIFYVIIVLWVLL